MTRSAVVIVFAVSLAGARASAQTAPAHVSVVEGAASISRMTGAEAAEPDLPLEPGDRVQTAEGRLEIVTGDGSVLHLDAQTTIDVNAAGVIRLLGGRVVVASALAGGESLQVDALPASVRLSVGSEGRLSLLQDAEGIYLDVAMVRGDAEVLTATSVASVAAGSRVLVRNGESPSDEMAFNSAESDPFYDWSNSLLDERRGTLSAQYLPPDLTSYSAALDQGGSWDYLAPYGYVWYPTVAVGWRPYFHGRWCWRDNLGWSFVGGKRWTWATHHYGRWGVNGSGNWFWVPGTAWSPAWVQWAVAPGFVSWCPLGSNNRPIGKWASHVDGGTGAPGHGWTTVRWTTFGNGMNVTRQTVDPRTLTGPNAPVFVQQTTPPPTAIARGSFGIAGRSVPAEERAVPRAPQGRPAQATAAATATTPNVVYYRGGSVSTGTQPVGRPHDRGAVMPHGGSMGAGQTVNTTRGFAVTGPQAPPIPYRNGPPIVAVPRATAPGGLHAGPPLVTGPPPMMGTPPAVGGAPPAAHQPGTPVAHAAPAPHAAPATTTQGSTTSSAHAVAAPRGGSPR
jgi:hypothetical protein